MCDDDDGYQTMGAAIVIACAPVLVAAVIEYIIAPAVAARAQPAQKKRTRRRTKAAAMGFASFVAHESRRR